MKKIIALSLIIGTCISLYSFNTNTNSIAEDNTIDNTELWDFMRKKVFPELDELVDYDKKSMFSRCPSGFGQHRDTEKSKEDMAYGTITFSKGCDREEFCFYKIDWNTKKTSLKKKEQDEYVAIAAFVETEKQKIAKI